MQWARYFSGSYFEARRRLLDAGAVHGARHETQPIAARGPRGEPLSLDVLEFGPAGAGAVLVVSSGLHGVEGYFGSAVQLAWLSNLAMATLRQSPVVRVVLLHALNPFGFAWNRRWNEDLVDVNRNFLSTGQHYAGSPARYRDVDPLINPASPPSRWEPFLLKALWIIGKYGFAPLREAVPVGQYDFPRGLFFGGHGPSETNSIVIQHLPRWIGPAKRVVHVDLHTGLGRWATGRLLVEAARDALRVAWWKNSFGEDRVSVTCSEGDSDRGAAYHSRGTWEQWCQARFADRDYNFATAEFGTYSPIRVIGALRAEQRAFLYAAAGDPRYAWARRNLIEAFAPASASWREPVVRDGAQLIDRAIATLSR